MFDLAYELLTDCTGISESSYELLIECLKRTYGEYFGIEQLEQKVQRFNGRCYILKDNK